MNTTTRVQCHHGRDTLHCIELYWLPFSEQNVYPRSRSVLLFVEYYDISSALYVYDFGFIYPFQISV